MRVIGKRLMVSVESEKVRASGIILQDELDTKSKKGEVIQVGNDVFEELKDAKTVYFKSRAGTNIKVDGEGYLMLKDSEVLAYE